MQINQPLQIQDGPNAGKWHYTQSNSTGTYAIGYCSRIQSCPDCLEMHSSWGTWTGQDKEGLRRLLEEYKFKHPEAKVWWCETCDMSRIKKLTDEEACPGHDTAEEARKHYRQYLVDTKFNFHDREDVQEKCQICNVWTNRVVDFVGEWGRSWILCPEHATKETLQRIYVDKELE